MLIYGPQHWYAGRWHCFRFGFFLTSMNCSTLKLRNMKKLFGLTLIAALGLTVPALAQDKKDNNVAKKAWKGTKKGADKAWKGTKKGAKTVGNETAELASKGAAKVHDNKSNDWVGPQGQTVYVDDATKYYYVDEKGKHVSLTQAELKRKEKQ
jgi:hypothetical protein